MKSDRIIRKKSDFDAIYGKGKSVGSRPAVILYRKNRLGYRRVAFVASKKVGNSVERNRARRLLRQCFRELETRLPEGTDFIFIARASCADSKTKYADVKKAIEAAMRKAGIIGKEMGEKRP